MESRANRARPDPAATFGTRRRVVSALAAGFASLYALQALVAATALAVNFTTIDGQFKVYSNYMQGVYGAGFMAQNNGATAVSQVGVAELGFKSAKLAGLCMISTEILPVVGPVSLVITGGVPVKGSFNDGALVTTDGGGAAIQYDAAGLLAGASNTNSVDVTDMYLASDLVRGYGNKINRMKLGQTPDQAAAETGLAWATDQGGAAPQAGNFGLNAERLNISGLDGSAYGVELAGGMRMPSLNVRSIKGTATQANCPG